jgi:hypothetical protein
MRARAIFALAFVLAAGLPASAQSQSRSVAAFEKLKTLAGSWLAKVPDGSLVPVSYEVTSSDSALVERIEAPGHTMVTVYHRDGNRLMMTHYCAAGNQPRMAAEPPAGDISTLTFKFLDVTNLASPTAGYMSGLTLTFKDPNHVTAVWTNHEDGKDVPWTFELERKN